MKHLWLIRHATAIQGDFSVPDFDRVLESSGIQEAKKTGEFILKSGIVPDLVFCSNSKRTMQTAEQVGLSLKKNIPVEAFRELYNAGFQTLQRSIQEADTSVETLALVAHNPGISQLATALATTGSFQLAPSSAVCLQFQIENWTDVKPGKGKELHYFYP